MKTNETNTELKTWVVYTHSTSDNTVFYIGCGKPSRPYQKTGRNNEWLNIAKDNNIQIQVEQEFFTPCEAYDYEMFLIDKFGRKDLNTGTLINKTDGGVGVKGLAHYHRTRKMNAELFDFETGQITTTSELNKSSNHARNYFFRLASGMRGDWSKVKFIDLMSNKEIRQIAKQYKNDEILKFIK